MCVLCFLKWQSFSFCKKWFNYSILLCFPEWMTKGYGVLVRLMFACYTFNTSINQLNALWVNAVHYCVHACLALNTQSHNCKYVCILKITFWAHPLSTHPELPNHVDAEGIKRPIYFLCVSVCVGVCCPHVYNQRSEPVELPLSPHLYTMVEVSCLCFPG